MNPIERFLVAMRQFESAVWQYWCQHKALIEGNIVSMQHPLRKGWSGDVVCWEHQLRSSGSISRTNPREAWLGKTAVLQLMEKIEDVCKVYRTAATALLAPHGQAQVDRNPSIQALNAAADQVERCITSLRAELGMSPRIKHQPVPAAGMGAAGASGASIPRRGLSRRDRIAVSRNIQTFNSEITKFANAHRAVWAAHPTDLLQAKFPHLARNIHHEVNTAKADLEKAGEAITTEMYPIAPGALSENRKNALILMEKIRMFVAESIREGEMLLCPGASVRRLQLTLASQRWKRRNISTKRPVQSYFLDLPRKSENQYVQAMIGVLNRMSTTAHALLAQALSVTLIRGIIASEPITTVGSFPRMEPRRDGSPRF